MGCIDITLDLETLSLSANAAILEIAAVAWDRKADIDPILPDYPPFISHVDLRSCVADGFDIDPESIIWWRSQPEKIRREVFYGEAFPLSQVLESFSAWLDDLKDFYKTENVYLWSQGSDFDIAILRNAFSRYGLVFPINHKHFRDARTFILEKSALLDGVSGSSPEDREKADFYPGVMDANAKHEAYSDVLWTSKQVWSVFRSQMR